MVYIPDRQLAFGDQSIQNAPSNSIGGYPHVMNRQNLGQFSVPWLQGQPGQNPGGGSYGTTPSWQNSWQNWQGGNQSPPGNAYGLQNFQNKWSTTPGFGRGFSGNAFGDSGNDQDSSLGNENGQQPSR